MYELVLVVLDEMPATPQPLVQFVFVLCKILLKPFLQFLHAVDYPFHSLLRHGPLFQSGERAVGRRNNC